MQLETMRLKHIEIDNLNTTNVNVRKFGKKDIADLLPSIRSLGILQPLLVRKANGEACKSENRTEANGDSFEIIAGQRRYYTALKLAEEGIKEALPCIIMQEGDDAKAIEASLAENIARLPMDEIDQYKAFANLAKQGRTATEIAEQFGITEQLVKKRLAIANIIQPILTLYRQEEINANTLRQFTLATKAQQKKWLELYKSEDEYAPQGYNLKEWLFGGSEIPVENALFDIGEYKGNIITDLFEETRYFDDTSSFWELQNNAIATKRNAYLESGWSEVVILDLGQYFHEWDYKTAKRKDGGKVYVSITHKGEVTFHEGFITQSEAKRRSKQTAGNEGLETTAERPELTKAMQNYLDLHRHSAVRTELLNHSGIALRLAIAQIIAGSSLWSVQADSQKANTDVIKDGLQSNKAEDVFQKQRNTVKCLLGIEDKKGDEAETLVPRKDDWNTSHDIHVIFTKLLTLSDKEVTSILTFVVAECLPVGSELVEAVGNLLNVNVGESWNAHDSDTHSVFLDLLRDKQAINALLKEVGGKQVADAHVSSTAKVQKSIIADYLNGTRTGGKAHWHPRYLAFPMKTYTKRGGIEALNKWKAIRKHYS